MDKYGLDVDVKHLQNVGFSTEDIVEIADEDPLWRFDNLGECVYIVSRERLYKIGYTSNLRQRLKALSAGSCMPKGMTVGMVDVEAVFPGNRVLEGELHKRFAAYRLPRTEWFTLGPELLDFLSNGYCSTCDLRVCVYRCQDEVMPGVICGDWICSRCQEGDDVWPWDEFQKMCAKFHTVEAA